MTADDVKALLAVAFENADITVTGESAKFEIAIIADDFAGKRPVPRQQMVYAVLNEQISSGEIHAVTMSLKTVAEAS